MVSRCGKGRDLVRKGWGEGSLTCANFLVFFAIPIFADDRSVMRIEELRLNVERNVLLIRAVLDQKNCRAGDSPPEI
jgi:hypothetical protein